MPILTDTIAITKEDLLIALTRWQLDYLDGKTLSHKESDAVPFEESNIERRDYLWSLLAD